MPSGWQIKKRNVFFYLLVFFGISFGGKALVFLTDYFWYQEIGLAPFFLKMFLTQASLWTGTALLILLSLFINFRFAARNSKKPFVIIEPDATVTSPLPFGEVKHVIYALLMVLGTVTALLAGNWAGSHWETALKSANAILFGARDPLFNLDIGFYVFSLPFYQFLYRLFATVLISSGILTAAVYFVEGRIYLTESGVQIADDAKRHLSLFAGAICVMLAARYQLQILELPALQRTLAPGAGYTDAHVLLPWFQFFRFMSLGAAIIFWVLPFGKRNAVSHLTTVIIMTVGPLLMHGYAGVVQKFQVGPNEIVKETPYIKFAIDHTRKAYGLTDIQELNFDPQSTLTAQDLKKNALTIKNIRLWEHRPLLTSYAQLQEIRTYYDFLDADNDRYWIDGEYRQIMVSARELSPQSLPSRIWINEHLTYTHGYGICLGPVNQISPEGLPEFFIKDIPPASIKTLKVTRPEIYYGESNAGYAIVKSASKEFDYPSGDENVYTEYKGMGGVPVKNFLRRFLFAWRFGEMKILFSKDIKPESRFLYYRSVRSRLEKAAPYLNFDADPYIVVTEDGRLVWIADAYTVTDRYPYSEQAGSINYIRNSVKATVDAYDGTIQLYIADASDPIIRTYASMFPGIYRPISEMPKDIRAHLRYPQTLMNYQALIYSTYHMTDPQVFYNKEDLWKIPMRTSGGESRMMEPYYTIMKLSEVGEKEEFILMVPFTPAKKENMISWMAARCDEPNYGKLLVYNFPKQKLVYGPKQIESRIDQDAEISKLMTLWNQGGSQVIRGSLLVIPVEQSLLYIQPLYLESSGGGGLPELKRIIAAYGNSIAIGENLELALLDLFSGRAGSISGDAPKNSVPPSEDLKTAVRQVMDHFRKARTAARSDDWGTYGAEMKTVEDLLKKISEKK